MKFLLLPLLLSSCGNSAKFEEGQCFLVDQENTIIQINEVNETHYILTFRVTNGTAKYQVPHLTLENEVRDFNFTAESCEKYKEYL